MMKRALTICGAVLTAVFALSTGAAGRTVQGGETQRTCTAEDVRNLRDFLLGKPCEEDLAGKPYDLNGDGKWNAADLTLMKREQLTAKDSSILVAYFSRTGNTEHIADTIIDLTGADCCVIEAAVPYTDDDIRYQDSECRANREQNDKTVRPEIARMPENLDSYDVIFLGYPIWWGEEPRIIDTFLESFDFSEKTVIPFCTSASSGIAASEKNIAALTEIGSLLPGKRFPGGASAADIRSWLDTLELPAQKIILEIGGTELTVTLADTQAAAELAEKLRDGSVTVMLKEYGGFEKVGDLPWTLTRSDVSTETVPGDLMLYQGSQITLFYNSNSWSYTALGRVTGMTQEALTALLGSGDVSAVLKPAH